MLYTQDTTLTISVMTSQLVLNMWLDWRLLNMLLFVKLQYLSNVSYHPLARRESRLERRVSRLERRVSRLERRESRLTRNETRLVTYIWQVLYITFNCIKQIQWITTVWVSIVRGLSEGLYMGSYYLQGVGAIHCGWNIVSCSKWTVVAWKILTA